MMSCKTSIQTRIQIKISSSYFDLIITFSQEE